MTIISRMAEVSRWVCERWMVEDSPPFFVTDLRTPGQEKTRTVGAVSWAGIPVTLSQS